jgi:glycerol-3-phosphate acyltransferase PlsY
MMLPMWPVVALLPVGWLLGTFPSAPLIARAHGHDVTKEGSGNPGASNVARIAGWKAGALVLLLDFAKGAIAAGIGLAVHDRVGAYALGVAAVLGHTFPLYRKGGKGVAAAAGMLIVLYPVIVVALAVVFALIAKVLKKASLASLTCTVCFPVAVALMGYDGWEVAVVSALAVLVLVRHAANIRRLLRREEHGLTPMSPTTPTTAHDA